MMKNNEQRRVDDSFLRKIIAGLIISLVLEAGGFVYSYGSLVERVDDIEEDIAVLQVVTGTITSIDNNLGIINTKVDYLTNRLDKNAKIVESIKTKQDKDSTIIKNAAEHLREHS